MSIDPLPRHRTGPARLVIADDFELARAGLRAMLTGQRGLKLVGEATNGSEALALCRRLQPDLALIDVRMPVMDGLATCQSIKQVCPATSVILITIHETPAYLLQALRAGAAGYVLKDITRHELITTVGRVLKGEAILNKDLVVRLLQHMDNKGASLGELASKPLSQRELEVLQLLKQGQTNREIAYNLSISVATVKIHVEHILAKLEVSDRTQAAVRAVELGLLHTPST